MKDNEKPLLRSIGGDDNKERTDAIVSMLEALLEEAKKGTYSDLAVIGSVRGAFMTDFLWESDNELMLVGALRAAEREVLDAYFDEIEGEEDEDDA